MNSTPYIYKPPPPPPSGVKPKSKAPAGSSFKPAQSRPQPYAPPTPKISRDISVVEPKSQSKISLNTEQEIQAWIAARKKNWPTESRVKEKARLEAQHKQNAPDTLPKEKPQGNAQRQCKFFAAGKCKNSQCRFAHITGSDSKPLERPKKYKLYEAPKKMPLFKMLVRNEMEVENRQIMEFIEYICENNII